MTKNAIISKFKTYAIGLTLLASTSFMALGQTNKTSNNGGSEAVTTALDHEQKYNAAKENLEKSNQTLKSLKELKTFFEQNAWIDRIPEYKQREYQALILKSSGSPSKMAETCTNIRNELNELAKNNPSIKTVPVVGDITRKMVNTYAGSAISRLGYAITNNQGKVNEAKKTFDASYMFLTNDQKQAFQSLHNLDKPQDNKPTAQSAVKSGTPEYYKQQLEKMKKYQVAVGEKKAELEDLYNRYNNAQWMDRFPENALVALNTALNQIAQKPENEQLAARICVLNEFYALAEKDANTFSRAPIKEKSAAMRKNFIGVISIDRANTLIVEEALVIEAGYSAEALKLAEQGNIKKAETVDKTREDVIALKQKLTPEQKILVNLEAQKNSYAYDLEVINAFQDNIVAEYEFVKNADYKELASGELLAEMQTQESLLETLKNKSLSETNQDFKKALEKQISVVESDFKDKDKEIKKSAEEVRKNALPELQEMYLLSIADEAVTSDMLAAKSREFESKKKIIEEGGKIISEPDSDVASSSQGESSTVDDNGVSLREAFKQHRVAANTVYDQFENSSSSPNNSFQNNGKDLTANNNSNTTRMDLSQDNPYGEQSVYPLTRIYENYRNYKRSFENYYSDGSYGAIGHSTRTVKQDNPHTLPEYKSSHTYAHWRDVSGKYYGGYTYTNKSASANYNSHKRTEDVTSSTNAHGRVYANEHNNLWHFGYNVNVSRHSHGVGVDGAKEMLKTVPLVVIGNLLNFK